MGDRGMRGGGMGGGGMGGGGMGGGGMGGGGAAVSLRQQVAVASELADQIDAPGGRPLFPVAEPLEPLLPGNGLRPGSVVAVRGSTALLLALLAAATARGTWAAVVGVGDLGVLSAVEAGVAVRRLALVPRPGPEPARVVAALLDGVSLVAFAGAGRMPSGARRSLAARARQRGAVLLALGPAGVGRWPGADVELDCRTEAWFGAEDGYGRLRSRAVVVRAGGRGVAARRRSARLLLPGPDGRAAAMSGAQAPVRPVPGQVAGRAADESARRARPVRAVS